MGIIIMLVISILIALFVKYVDNKYKKIELKEVMENNKVNENNKKYKEENNIPKNASLLCYTNIDIEDKWNVFVWKENNMFNFCGASKNDDIRKITIPINNIQFYTRKGDYRVETISEGGDISVGNAILGGIVGLVIGSIVGFFILGGIVAFVGLLAGVFLTSKRKIIITNKEIDNRKTYLNYLEDNENKQMIFTSKDYDTLLKVMPEKEITYIENNKTIESNNSQNDIYKYIEELAKLRDKGILAEDEFNNKKQLLLNKIQ